MPIDEANFQFRAIRDPRLAPLAASSLPAWLWANDGSHILWANAAGAAVFGAEQLRALTTRRFGPPDRRRRQIARLAGRLQLDGSVRLERLRWFGAPLGGLLTCGCRRLVFGKGEIAVLVVAAGPIGRPLPLKLRLQRLLAAFDDAAAAFDAEGFRLAANQAAESWLMDTATGGGTLAALGMAETAAVALHEGSAEIPVEHGRLLLQRIGSGAEPVLLVIGQTTTPLEATPAPAPEAAAPTPEPIAPEAVPDSTPEAPAAEAPEPRETIEPRVSDAPVAVVASDTDRPLAAALEEPEETAACAVADLSGPATMAGATEVAPAPPAAPPAPRRHPLRFLWQIDADGHFSVTSDEFARLIGPRTSAAFDHPWTEIVDEFGIDPEDRVAAAIASRNTWSGITVHWPADGTDAVLDVELSGLPVYDNDRNFHGYRGFGVCRDIDALHRLAAQRHMDAANLPASSEAPSESKATPSMVDTPPPASPPDTDRPADTFPNVVLFRPSADAKAPTLSPGENVAFNELARQLAERLAAERDALDRQAATEQSIDKTEELTQPEPSAAPTVALAPAPHVSALFDLVPAGVLIYRLDRLLYANRAFLARVGHPDLAALAAAGGLDALYVKNAADAAAAGGTPVTIESPGHDGPIDARLHDVDWDGKAAHALIFANAPAQPATATPAPPVAAIAPGATEQQLAELAAILDEDDDAILLLEDDGRVGSCNRGAETLFARTGEALAGHALADLFAAADRDTITTALAAASDAPARHELDALGADSKPLKVAAKFGRVPGGRRFAILRPRPVAAPATAPDDGAAQRLAERAAAARADILARISHELRAPLNAIIGFADVMIEERFGALGNERYAAYLKDMRAAGERVLGVLGDFLDLSRAETGKLDLAFARQDLNDVVEKCVTIMQPQANRERIIIRTALSHALPQVTADANALRQIVLNLVGNSIHVARAGGQVIVSTALTDFGDVVLRVRDTGRGLNHAELTEAIEQFRHPDSDQLAQDNAGVNLSLTKALVEANRAQFHIRSAPHSGTLVEVAFPPQAKAG